MSAPEKDKKGFTRREFLKGAAVASAAVASAGMLSACGAKPTTPVAPSVPEKWDREADVVVVGGGATGIPAALSAAEAGA